MSAPEFSRPLRLDQMGNARSETIVASRDECQALVRRFDLLGIDRLSAEIELKPDTFAKKNCLVVRLGYAPTETVVARPFGPTPTGGESRVYQSAGKSTCLFWWVDADQSKLVTGFELVSVNAAKKAAHSVVLPTLPPPAPAGPQPTPTPR